MKDKELNRQLNKMREIKPHSDWVEEVENDIIGSPSRNVLSIFQFSFTRYATVAILIMAMIFGGVMLYQDNPESEVSSVSETEIKSLISSLQGLKTSIDKVAQIENLNSGAGKQVVVQGNQVARAVNKITEDKELTPEDKEVVASLQSELEQSTEKLQKKLYKEEAQRKIDLLKKQEENGILSEEKKVILEKSEELIENEKYIEAILKLERISQ